MTACGGELDAAIPVFHPAQYEPDGQRCHCGGAGAAAAPPESAPGHFLCPLGRGAVPATVSGVSAVGGVALFAAGRPGPGDRRADQPHRICAGDHPASRPGPHGASRGSDLFGRGTGGRASHPGRRAALDLAGRGRGHGPLGPGRSRTAAAEAADRLAPGRPGLLGGRHCHALCAGPVPTQDLSPLVPGAPGARIHPAPRAAPHPAARSSLQAAGLRGIVPPLVQSPGLGCLSSGRAGYGGLL